MSNITFNNVELHLQEHSQHEFLLSNKEVSLGYGVVAKTINDHRSNHKDELLENKHWIRLSVQTKGGKQKVIHWTKKGIVRLGFFIKSENAKKFRDWAEDYIVNAQQQIPQPTHHQINGYKSQPSQHNSKIRDLEKQNALLQAKLEQALTPDSIWNIVNDGLKYREAKKQVKELAPLFA